MFYFDPFAIICSHTSAVHVGRTVSPSPYIFWRLSNSYPNNIFWRTAIISENQDVGKTGWNQGKGGLDIPHVGD